MHRILSHALVSSLVLFSIGCPSPKPPVAGPRETNIVSSDESIEGSTSLDPRDLNAAADKIVRALLSQPKIAGRTSAPTMIIDATEGWVNQSSARMNLNMLADKISINVTKRAEGRVLVVEREWVATTEKENALMRDGVVGGGTEAPTDLPAGADYRLFLRISGGDAVSTTTGTTNREFYLAFRLINRKNISVWADEVSVRKRGTDDVVYQ